ncbi:MAG: DNA-directed RNA polymerase subunit alpha C-terminal domain-containing protein [Candidatus Paceibacterota bacterium]
MEEAFDKLGYAADIEESNSGAVLLKNGDLLWFDSNAAPIDAGDYAPYIHGRLTSDMKGSICIYDPEHGSERSFKKWITMIEEAGSPVKEEETYGTWEEIYNIAAKYADFRNSMIPPIDNIEAKEKFLDTSLYDLEVSTRVFTSLAAQNILTPRDLLGYTASELLKFNNFGKKTLPEIVEILKRYDLQLKD